MFRKTTLKNGLRIITQEMESTASVTVLVLVGAGSRYETKEINGISHFLEHMFFKGAERYPDTKAVSSAIDAVGGDFNAFTGKEYAGYYVKVAADHLKLAMDVLSDMMVNSKFDSKEIDKERGVILEEYNMYQDTPMYQVGWDFERLLFGDQPMGWDQVGTKELIQSVKHEDFVKYKEELYAPNNVVLSVVGNIKHEGVVERAEEFFTFAKKKKAYDWKPIEPLAAPHQVYLKNKKTEQAHLVLGFPGYPENHEDHYVKKVLSVMLGGNMSSRMFLGVREKQGLAYYIQTTTDDYMDAGVLSTRAGVDLKRADLAVTAIIDEYKQVVEEGIKEDEVTRGKDYLKGKLTLRLEDSEEYAHLLGKYELLYDKVRKPAKILERLDAVMVADIERVAKDILKEENLRLAMIGPFDEKEKFEKLLKF